MDCPRCRWTIIQIHPRDHDLILATHGRSLWIMDDITPLEEMSDNVLSADLHLFDMRPVSPGTWRTIKETSARGISWRPIRPTA